MSDIQFIYHGWYSEKCAVQLGYNVHIVDDVEAKITMITKTKEQISAYLWDDIVFVGMVDIHKFVRNVKGLQSDLFRQKSQIPMIYTPSFL